MKMYLATLLLTHSYYKITYVQYAWGMGGQLGVWRSKGFHSLDLSEVHTHTRVCTHMYTHTRDHLVIHKESREWS